jgi:hypothetical protein
MTETKWGIYINNNFTGEYASSPLEAQRYIVQRAKEELKKYVPELTQERPLWRGEEPESDGHWLIYGLPGPKKSVVNIVQYTTTRPWFGAATRESRVVYNVSYETIQRVKLNQEEEPQAEEEHPQVDASYEQGPSVKKYRDPSNPHDQLLNAIERGKKLRSH